MIFDSKKLFLVFTVGFIVLELLSWLGYNYPFLSGLLFVLVVLATIILSWINIGYGVLVVLAELFVGSQGGYMLAIGSANIETAILSLRMGVFLAVFGVWGIQTVLDLLKRSKPAWLEIMLAKNILWPYLILLIVFTFGFIRGVVSENSFGNVFFDANGYAFFALFPAFVIGFKNERVRTLLWYILASAIVVTTLKALGVLYFFSHRIFEVAANMYVWIRDTRVGEVTIMQADFHRVFFQSHLYSLVGLFGVFLFLLKRPLFRGLQFWNYFLLLTLGMVAMILGLSRSFWFGGFVGVILLIAVLFYFGANKIIWQRLVGLGLMTILISVGLIFLVYSFPYPNKTGKVSFGSMLSGRATAIAGEAAASSRWELLSALWPLGLEHPIFGSGLGTEVVYTTYDPRLLADIPDGQYRTFAFEWGYHDLWIKFGLLGLIVYAWFIAVILKPFVRHIKNLKNIGFSQIENHSIIVVGIAIGTVAMLATNIFSPYLNHPLGIGLLMTVCALGLYLNKEEIN